MNDDPIYLLDADVLIQAAKGYYAFDIAPGFWQQLIFHASRGRVLSIDRVLNPEIMRGKDHLAQWASSDFSTAFASTDQQDVIQSYSEIISWVQSQTQFKDYAKANFADGADGWLIAFAKVNGCVIATNEVLNLKRENKVPIPNVCQAFGIKYINTWGLLRALEIILTWNSTLSQSSNEKK
jgi:hypothetical protein